MNGSPQRARLGAALALAVMFAAGLGVTAARGGARQATVVTAANSRAALVFRSRDVRADVSLRSRRDPHWALVDGTATPRHLLWAAWLHLDTGGDWTVRYFVTTAPFQPASATRGRVPCDLVPAFGEPRCHPAPTGPQIRVALIRQLKPSGQAARIGALLRNGGYSFSLTAPVTSSIRLEWYASARNARRRTLIGQVTADFLTHRSGRVRLALTRAGTRILTSSRTLEVTAEVTLTPILYADVRARRSFVLRR